MAGKSKSVSASKSDENLVKEIAFLARLDFEPEEIKVYASQMRSIINHFEDLKEVSLEGINPTVQINPVRLPLADDEIEGGLTLDSGLGNSRRRKGSLLSVPRIVNPGEEPFEGV